MVLHRKDKKHSSGHRRHRSEALPASVVLALSQEKQSRALSRSIRNQRICSKIRDELSFLLLRNDLWVREFDRFAPTISEVRVSSDLSMAKIFVRGSDTDDGSKTIATLSRNARALRRALAEKLQLRSTPALSFYLDDRFDHAEKTDRLIKNLREKPSGPQFDDMAKL